MKRVSLAVARRFASALLDVALQGPGGDMPETIRQEMRQALGVLADHKNLADVLGHPTLPVDRKKQIVAEVWGGPRSSVLFRRFMELLVDRKHVGLLPVIEASFSALWNEHRNVTLAEVVSAVTLPPTQVEAIAGALESVAARGVEIRAGLDPTLLGGVLVRMGGRSYDGTVRGRLMALRERLAKGA